MWKAHDAVEKLPLPRARNFAWKNDAIRSAIRVRWPQGRHFPSPSGTVGPPLKSFSTASCSFGTIGILADVDVECVVSECGSQTPFGTGLTNPVAERSNRLD